MIRYTLLQRVSMQTLADQIVEQYGADAYTWSVAGPGVFLITCPDHGAFNISFENFLYMRGCNACRGVHPRGYPARSTRTGLARDDRPPIPRRSDGGRPPDDWTLHLTVMGSAGSIVGFGISPTSTAPLEDVIYSRVFAGRPLAAAARRLIATSFKMIPRGKGRQDRFSVEWLPDVVTMLEGFHVARRFYSMRPDALTVAPIAPY